jgi:hypothetical protein
MATVETEGFAALQKKLEELQTKDPGMRKAIQDVIRTVLKEVRRAVSNSAKSGLGMDSDPRKAYKAVRSAVYKRILGGQVNILARRKAGKPGNYQKPKKGLPKRGGNRWGRSDRTKQLEGYEGMDRGFVLRFLNAGTVDRGIWSYSDRDGNRHALGSARSMNIKTRAYSGNRGNIKARNWFGDRSQKELENASEKLQRLIDEVIMEKFMY